MYLRDTERWYETGVLVLDRSSRELRNSSLDVGKKRLLKVSDISTQTWHCKSSGNMYLEERDIRTMPGQEQDTRVGAVPSRVSVASYIIPGLVWTPVDARNLVPRELVGLGKALHTLQTKQVYIEHICIEGKFTDFDTEREGSPDDPLFDSGYSDVVCHICVL